MNEPTLNCEDCGIEVARLCWPCFIKRTGGEEATARAAGIDAEEQAAVLDDAIPEADFGEVARSEVMLSVIRALNEQGYEVAVAAEKERP